MNPVQDTVFCGHDFDCSWVKAQSGATGLLSRHTFILFDTLYSSTCYTHSSMFFLKKLNYHDSYNVAKLYMNECQAYNIPTPPIPLLLLLPMSLTTFPP